MPRNPRITAVPVEAPVEEGLAKAWGDDEVRTDAQEMTELVNQIKVDEEPALSCEVESTPVAKPKARAKRAPKKPVEVEPVDEPMEEPQQVEQAEEPDEGNWTKVERNVACPDCGKQMSAKTLKYSHGPNCAAKQQKQSPREISPSVIEEVIENEVQKR